MKRDAFKLVKKNLIEEYNFLNSHYDALYLNAHSNRQGLQSSFKGMRDMVSSQPSSVQDLLVLDIYLGKINTYIAMASLNDMQDHSMELVYVTRLPSLLFKMHINKLMIIESLKIKGRLCNIKTLPPEIGLLQQLKYLDLTDCGLRTLPKEIGELSHLEKISLEGNDIASVPKEIGKLTLLKEINLSNNPKLTRLPEEIGNCTSLEIMNAHDDGLISLPKSIGKLKSLRILDLNYNQLSELPLEMNGLSHLQVLKLRHNHLKKLFSALQLPHLSKVELAENEELEVPLDWNKYIH